MRPRRWITLVLVAAVAAVLAVPAVRRPLLQALDRLGDASRAQAGAPGAAGEAAPDSQSARPDGEAPRAARLPVAGVVVRAQPFVLMAHGTGRAEALQRAQLASRVGERVTAVHVREGDRVRLGDPLVELDRRPFEMGRREAAARLESARIDLAALAFDDSSVSDEKRARMAARTGVTEAEQRLARAQLDLDATLLAAPFDGEVVDVAVAVGERTAPDRVLVTLVDRSRIRIPAEVLESSFAGLAPGSTAAVRFPSLGDTLFTGRVAALAPELDGARGTGIAWVEMPNPDGRIKPGMYCEVDIEAARFADRLSVPRPAVLERTRRLLVFVARSGRAEWSYVETGLESDDRIEITSGVAPGDTVLVDGHLTLAHGAPIRVALTPEPAAAPAAVP